MEASSDHSTSRNDMRRSIEKAAVHQALEKTLGIIYPTQISGYRVELHSCENCPRTFSRSFGSGIRYCGPCIAKMKA